MITRTIGVSGNHADVAAWVSYVQSNYVSGGNLTDDQTGAITVGGMTVSTAQVISGWAPGGSNYSTTLTFDPASSNVAWFGQNCRTNALFYNTARGAFISSTYSATSGAITWRVDKNRTIGLMIKVTGGYTSAVRWDTTTQTDIICEGNILWATSDVNGAGYMSSAVDGTSIVVRNNLFISERSAGGSCAFLSDGNSTFSNRIKIYDNVFYADGASAACRMGSGTYVETIGNVFIPRIGNCGLSARDAQTNGSNNATNQSAWNNTGYGAGTLTGLTSNQFSITVANEFVGVTTGAMATDFRLKSGGTQLQGTNITISGVTVDITGVTRTSPTDIGPYQFATGGNVYNVSLSESGSANDNVSASCVFPRAVNESPLLTDAYSSQATQGVSIADTLSPTDTYSQGAVINDAIAENAPISDAYNNVAIFPRSLVESAPINDLISSQATQGVSIAESAPITDQYPTTAIFPRSIVETASAVDTISATSAYVTALVEVMSAANVQAALVVYPVSIAESAPITDLTNGVLPGDTNLVETMNALDLYSCTVIYATSIGESSPATDAYAASCIFPRSIAESASPTDAYNAAGVFAVSIAEARPIADFLSCVSQLTAAIAESMTPDDIYTADDVERRATKCNTLSGAPRVRRLEGAPRVRKLGGRSCE